MKAQDPAKHVSNADAKSGYEIADASFLRPVSKAEWSRHRPEAQPRTRQEQARRPQGQRRGALSLRSPSC